MDWEPIDYNPPADWMRGYEGAPWPTQTMIKTDFENWEEIGSFMLYEYFNSFHAKWICTMNHGCVE